MKTLKIIISVLITVILSGCVQKTIYLNQDTEELKYLTLTSIPSNVDTFRICVNMSDGIDLVDSADVYITDATVEVYDENMNLLDRLIFDTASLYDYPMYKSHIIPEIGKKYTIKASYQDKWASASFIIPEPVKIIEASVKYIDSSNYDNDYYEATLRINDPDTANSYAALAFLKAKYYYYTYTDTTYDSTLVEGKIYLSLYYKNEPNTDFDINSEDIPYAAIIQLNYFRYLPLIKDLTFNGQTVDLKFEFYIWENLIDWDSTITFALFTIPDETYQYYKTLQLYERNRNNPFVEPVNVYTNVENGFGAVVPLSADTVRVRIPSVR